MNLQWCPYSNNNGTQNWAGSWTETGDDGTAGSGSVKVASAQLQLANTNRRLQRTANLTSAVAATLSFQYKRSGLDDANDYRVFLKALLPVIPACSRRESSSRSALSANSLAGCPITVLGHDTCDR